MNQIQEFVDLFKKLEETISCNEIEPQLTKIEKLLSEIVKKYLSLKYLIYNILETRFNKSIIHSKSVEEKIISVDSIFIELIEDIQNIIQNIEEISQTKNINKNKLIQMQHQNLIQQKEKMISTIKSILSIFLDIIEILNEFNENKNENE